jgi:hypothetical protein
LKNSLTKICPYQVDEIKNIKQNLTTIANQKRENDKKSVVTSKVKYRNVEVEE